MQLHQNATETILRDDYGRWIAAYSRGVPTLHSPHIWARYWDLDDLHEYYWNGESWLRVPSYPRFTDDLWDDLRFPAQAINPPGAASDPDRESTTGFLLFDAGSTEVIMGMVQMPHEWKSGSAISPHIHWTPTTAGGGNVLWRLEYQIRNALDTTPFDFTTGWTTVDMLTAAGATANLPLLSAWEPDITMTGYKSSTLIPWRVSRIGGNAADTYAADARLLEFDIHYQKDKMGTATPVPE